MWPRNAPKVVTFNLVAKEVVAEIAPAVAPDPAIPGDTAKPAQKYWFWTFAELGGKATVPGPLLRVMKGDTVVIHVTNEIVNASVGNREPHNLDFHAAMGPGGGAAVTNVAPGETKTVTFKATRAGAYIYHCMAVTPGSAAMFELDANVPGRYLLVDHALFRVPKGAGGFLDVAPLVPGVWPTKLYAPPAW